ncbi:hypothetical protein INT48_002543 [Thamnidium elegans]|uniref:Uncharacterized protein n=1 Tax=Thamnidium elegans TaxID=101142 RepID=A0A8H7VXG0_9FUNG|nr:hypothetical protein INT48_002543 [Thamnidium elegans]
MIVALQQRHRLETLWLVAVIVFPLHLYWFYGILTQQLNRYSIHWSSLYKPNPPMALLSKRRKPKHSFLDKIYTI